MTASEFGIVSVDEEFDRGEHEEPTRVSVTECLGCSDTTVDVIRFTGKGSVPVPPERERLCIPFGDGQVSYDGRETAVPPRTLCRLPADVEADLEATDPMEWVVVGAETSASAGSPVVLDIETMRFVEPSTSAILTARLSAELGCAGMKVNARRLRPGDRVPYHTEGRQEELFIPIEGDSPAMLIAGDRYDLPIGSLARVAPQTPRSAMNSGRDDSTWIMVGAPPTGEPEDWGPGATILDWPD